MKTMLGRTAIRILSQGSHSLTLHELISPASSSFSPHSVKKRGGEEENAIRSVTTFT